MKSYIFLPYMVESTRVYTPTSYSKPIITSDGYILSPSLGCFKSDGKTYVYDRTYFPFTPTGTDFRMVHDSLHVVDGVYNSTILAVYYPDTESYTAYICYTVDGGQNWVTLFTLSLALNCMFVSGDANYICVSYISEGKVALRFYDIDLDEYADHISDIALDMDNVKTAGNMKSVCVDDDNCIIFTAGNGIYSFNVETKAFTTLIKLGAHYGIYGNSDLTDWIDSGADNFEVISDIGGHDDPIYVKADSGINQRFSFEAAESGSMECFMRLGQTNKRVDLRVIQNSGTSNVCAVLFATDGYIDFSGATADSNIQTYSANTWYHIRVVWYKNTNCYLYLDGSLISTITGGDFTADQLYFYSGSADSVYYIDCVSIGHCKFGNNAGTANVLIGDYPNLYFTFNDVLYKLLYVSLTEYSWKAISYYDLDADSIITDYVKNRFYISTSDSLDKKVRSFDTLVGSMSLVLNLDACTITEFQAGRYDDTFFAVYESGGSYYRLYYADSERDIDQCASYDFVNCDPSNANIVLSSKFADVLDLMNSCIVNLYHNNPVAYKSYLTEFLGNVTKTGDITYTISNFNNHYQMSSILASALFDYLEETLYDKTVIVSVADSDDFDHGTVTFFICGAGVVSDDHDVYGMDHRLIEVSKGNPQFYLQFESSDSVILSKFDLFSRLGCIQIDSFGTSGVMVVEYDFDCRTDGGYHLLDQDHYNLRINGQSIKTNESMDLMIDYKELADTIFRFPTMNKNTAYDYKKYNGVDRTGVVQWGSHPYDYKFSDPEATVPKTGILQYGTHDNHGFGLYDYKLEGTLQTPKTGVAQWGTADNPDLSAWTIEGNVSIVDDEDGHLNPMRIYCYDTTDEKAAVSFSESATGFIEFFFKDQVAQNRFQMSVTDGAATTHSLNFRTNSGYFQQNGVNIVAYTIDTWYRILLTWDTSSTWSVTINGTAYTGYAFQGTPTLMDHFWCYYSDVSFGNSIMFIDAVGISVNGYVNSVMFGWNGEWKDGSGAGCNISVIESIGNHGNVMSLTDISSQSCIIEREFPAIAIGTIQIMIMGSDVSNSCDILLWTGTSLSSVNVGVQFFINDDRFQYYGSAGVTDVGLAAVDNQWYLCTIVFDCTTDTYALSINGVSYGTLTFRSVQSSFTKLRIRTSGTDTGYIYYIDTIGYSWDGYTGITALNMGDVVVNNADIDSQIYISENVAGHENVLWLYDPNNASYDQCRINFSSPQTEGYIYFWWRRSGGNVIWFRVFDEGADDSIYIYLNHAGSLKIYYNTTLYGIVGITSDAYYYFKIYFNCSTGYFSVWINDTLAAENYILRGTPVTLNYINLLTWSGGSADAGFDSIGLSWEGATSYNHCILPGWIYDQSTCGCYTEIADIDGHKGSIALVDNNTLGASVVYIPFSQYHSSGFVEFYVRSSDVSNRLNVILRYSTSRGPRFGIQTGYFVYYNGSAWVNIVAMSADVWYHVKILFECGFEYHDSLMPETFKVYINGTSYGPYTFSTTTIIVFDHFLTDTSANYTLTRCTMTHSGSAMRKTSTADDPYFSLTGTLADFNGAAYRWIVLRYKWISGSVTTGRIYYSTSGHGFSDSYCKNIDLLSDGQWHTFWWDMSSLTAGGTDWITSTITDIRWDFAHTHPFAVDIDFMAVATSILLKPIDNLYIYTETGTSGYTCYVDAFGFSWDGYEASDNIPAASLPYHLKQVKLCASELMPESKFEVKWDDHPNAYDYKNKTGMLQWGTKENDIFNHADYKKLDINQTTAKTGVVQWGTVENQDLSDFYVYPATSDHFTRIANYQNHLNVVELVDNSASGSALIRIYTSPPTYGFFEFFVAISDSAMYGRIAIHNHILFTLTAGFFKNNTTNIVALSSNTLYHIKITYESTAGGYDGLAQYTHNYYIDGTKYGPYPFFVNGWSVDDIEIYTGNVFSGYSFFVDAFGLSGDGYIANYNRIIYGWYNYPAAAELYVVDQKLNLKNVLYVNQDQNDALSYIFPTYYGAAGSFVEFKIILAQTNRAISPCITTSANYVWAIVFNNAGTIDFYGTTSSLAAVAYSANVVIRVKVVWSPSSDCLFYINDALIVTLTACTFNPDRFLINQTTAGQGQYWIDSIGLSWHDYDSNAYCMMERFKMLTDTYESLDYGGYENVLHITEAAATTKKNYYYPPSHIIGYSTGYGHILRIHVIARENSNRAHLSFSQSSLGSLVIILIESTTIYIYHAATSTTVSGLVAGWHDIIIELDFYSNKQSVWIDGFLYINNLDLYQSRDGSYIDEMNFGGNTTVATDMYIALVEFSTSSKSGNAVVNIGDFSSTYYDYQDEGLIRGFLGFRGRISHTEYSDGFLSVDLLGLDNELTSKSENFPTDWKSTKEIIEEMIDRMYHVFYRNNSIDPFGSLSVERVIDYSSIDYITAYDELRDLEDAIEFRLSNGQQFFVFLSDLDDAKIYVSDTTLTYKAVESKWSSDASKTVNRITVYGGKYSDAEGNLKQVKSVVEDVSAQNDGIFEAIFVYKNAKNPSDAGLIAATLWKRLGSSTRSPYKIITTTIIGDKLQCGTRIDYENTPHIVERLERIVLSCEYDYKQNRGTYELCDSILQEQDKARMKELEQRSKDFLDEFVDATTETTSYVETDQIIYKNSITSIQRGVFDKTPVIIKYGDVSNVVGVLGKEWKIGDQINDYDNWTASDTEIVSDTVYGKALYTSSDTIIYTLKSFSSGFVELNIKLEEISFPFVYIRLRDSSNNIISQINIGHYSYFPSGILEVIFGDTYSVNTSIFENMYFTLCMELDSSYIYYSVNGVILCKDSRTNSNDVDNLYFYVDSMHTYISGIGISSIGYSRYTNSSSGVLKAESISNSYGLVSNGITFIYSQYMINENKYTISDFPTTKTTVVGGPSGPEEVYGYVEVPSYVPDSAKALILSVQDVVSVSYLGNIPSFHWVSPTMSVSTNMYIRSMINGEDCIQVIVPCVMGYFFYRHRCISESGTLSKFTSMNVTVVGYIN